MVVVGDLVAIFPLATGRPLPFRIQSDTTSNLSQVSPDFYRPSIERSEMRFVLLCFLIVVGSMAQVYGQQPKAITNSIGIKLVLIHAGSFTMGSPEGDLGRNENETPHEVTISKSYYLGIYEVTQREYEKVIGKNPSAFKEPKNPVEMVTWDDAVTFCKKLSEMPDEKAAARVYRLPTEAEWEYACRAVSTTSYSFGDNEDELREYAWFGEGWRAVPQQVGEKKANRWGLYDMHGNVWELCQDWYDDYPHNASTDPQGPNTGSDRVVRGGCRGCDASFCRSAFRHPAIAPRGAANLGFRLALRASVQLPEAEENTK